MGEAPISRRVPKVPDAFYRAFEDRFRGSRDLIRDRLIAGYKPFVDHVAAQGNSRALDLGCGRGEWLEILRESGIDARGVDLDDGMLEAARTAGLDVERCDALEALRGEADGALALISGFHIAEHLPFAELLALMTEARRALRPGGLLILETPNPENLVVGTANFHLDPTHIAPIPVDRLAFMAEFAGFARSAILRLNGPEPGTPSLLAVFTDISPDYAIVAQVEGGDCLPMDEAIAQRVGSDLSTVLHVFDRTLAGRLAELEASSTRDESLQEALLSRLSERVDRLADRDRVLSEELAARADWQDRLSRLSERVDRLADRHRVLSEELAARADWRDRPLWERLLFRPSGRPTRLLRRLSFHNSGRPRGGILRGLARRRDGTPRAAFARWMSSRSYLSLPWPARRHRNDAPPPEEPLGPDPARHPRREALIDALRLPDDHRGTR